MFEKVQTRKVYMEIVEQIQDLIKQGRLKPGDKLPAERILADKLGVSRPPLREALSALEILGTIESRGGKGNFIKDSFDSTSYARQLKELEQEESPFELLEARKVVETEIAGLAAEKATPEDAKKIEETLNEMRNVLSDIPRAMEFDREFHVAIAKAAYNSLLFQMMNHLADGLKEKLWINLKKKCWSLPDRPQKYLEKHIELFEAIKKGDKEVARKAMHDHLVDVEKDLLKE